jgi:hypothetical protein
MPCPFYHMATFATMLSRFKSFDATQATGEAMKDNESEVLDVNREQLYEKGTDKFGSKLPDYKSKPYAKKKLGMRGKSIVDLYLTGDMQRDMEIEVKGDTYEVTSTAEYTPYVLNRRPNSFGFTQDGKQVVWHIVRPDFVKRLATHTQTGM